MVTIPSGNKRPYNSIYRSSKSSKLSNNQSLEPTADEMGAAVGELQHKIVYGLGKQGGKPDAFSIRREYHPEEGATLRQHSILKPVHSQITLVQEGHN